ncbi:MAG TPA: glycosyltransferase 87 family protein, partial [Gemmataceae bacterium]|nr:glycosyltransferase 87 family protein [Gemmataceae bacterium]
ALSKPGSQSVVPIYLEAARAWVRGDNLYHWEPPRDLYRNPPGFAAAFVPFTLLPETGAEIAWRAVGAAVFLLGLGRWVRHGLPRPLTPAETGAVFLLAAPLALASLNNGQTNLILIGLLLLGATAAARQQWRTAGAWLAAAATLKVYPLAVGLLVGLGAPRRLFPWLAVWCVLFAAVPFLLHDPAYVLDQHWSFRATVRADDRTFANLHRAPRDLFLVLRVWFTPPAPAVYLGVKLAAAAGMAGLVVLVVRRTPDMRIAAPLALHLGCVWVTVLGPATETHTYTLLGPSAATVPLFAWADRASYRGKPRLVLALLGYGLLVSPVFRDIFPNGTEFQILGPQPVGGLLVLAVVVWDALRTRHPTIHPIVRSARVAVGYPHPESAAVFPARAEAGEDMIGVCPTQ